MARYDTKTFSLTDDNLGHRIMELVPASTTLPVISSFAADPTSFVYGGGTTHLTWGTSGATSLSLNNGVGDVTGTTEIYVPVTSSVIFTLTAVGPGGQIESSLLITVLGLVDGFAINQIVPSHQKVTLTAPVSLKDNKQSITDWSITQTGVDTAIVSVNDVRINGDTITIDTTEQTQGGSYTLNIPCRYILNSLGTQQCVTQTLNFTGVGESPKVFNITVDPDRNYLDVIFDEDMYAPDALDPGNYLLDNGASVSYVVQLNAASYRLYTTPLTPNVTYNLTTNVRDIYFNA